MHDTAKQEKLRQHIAELKLLLSKATAGPWKSCIEARDGIVGESFLQTGDQDIYFAVPVSPDDAIFDFRGGVRYADQDLMAAARNYLPELLDELERLLNQPGQ